MAEFVQQSLEEMVGELHEMQTVGLFDGPEIRYIYDTCPQSTHVDQSLHAIHGYR